MKKFAKGTTTLLATALVFQSTPIVQAASYSQDRSNQLSVFGSTSTPSLSTQAVYECLTLYQEALQDSSLTSLDLEKLRENALLALDFLDHLSSRPDSTDLEQLLGSIALIRQFDEGFPIYQPHSASWPKSPKPSLPQERKKQELEKTEEPVLSLLEASHRMDSTPQSPGVQKVSPSEFLNAPTSSQSNSASSIASSSIALDSSSSSLEEDPSENSLGVRDEPSQTFQEETPSEVPFEDISSFSSVSSSEESLFQDPTSPLQTPIPALQEEPSIQEALEPALTQSASSLPTAIVILDGTKINQHLTAWLSEDPNDFLNPSFSDSTSDDSLSPEESQEPASIEPIPIQTIEPLFQEPSVVEEMPSEEPILEEPDAIEEADSSIPQEASENKTEEETSSHQNNGQTDSQTPIVAPIQETKPASLPVQEPVNQEVPQEDSSTIQMEEVDLAPIEKPKSFSIFDYVKLNSTSSLLEAVYPGLGIGPLPSHSIAALPVLFKDDFNQNPQDFDDRDDVSTEGRPQKDLQGIENIQGIPEYFEEMDENDTPSPSDVLPPLPSDGEDEDPQATPSPTPDQMDPIIVDVSDKDLGFDIMPDFDPSIIMPAPANPLLPDPSQVVSTPSSQEQRIVDSWASAPTVSTPTLSQSITVRQLNKRQNRRLKIADMGIITLLPNYEDSFAWKKAASPYNTPLLWGQCTWFAWGRFYDLYGYSPGFSGNGYDCVSQLLQTHGDKFKLSKTPASGAVFSSDVAHNHVGIVLDYDAKKDLLTIQEGNLDGISNSNWDEAIEDYRTLRLSSSDIRTLYGDVTYAVPKEGTKFIGYEETEKALAQKESAQTSEKKTTKTKDTSHLKNLRALCFEKLKALLFLEEEMEELEKNPEEMESSPSSKGKEEVLSEDFEWMEG